ncbi:TPA: hypothetical protein N0F65_003052 [Lagenidium giganteum]|uniref:Uncharacterized protein n=1 Tax=Lagenidium giganteum TaxID=4803 RepID=A0AAV2YGY1_9STRA|nr:TPA: hypothetical protein N0F65_003052 [Lagenidium giganteum]
MSFKPALSTPAVSHCPIIHQVNCSRICHGQTHYDWSSPLRSPTMSGHLQA